MSHFQCQMRTGWVTGWALHRAGGTGFWPRFRSDKGSTNKTVISVSMQKLSLRSQICFAPGKSKTPISLGGQIDIKEKSFLFAASVHSLEPRSLLEQTVLEILESYDCVSHFVPRAEYLVQHFAATHWRRRHQLFPEMHTPGRSYPVLFSLHGGLQEMPLSSYVFPPDSVKPLLGCGHSFSFLCTLVE